MENNGAEVVELRYHCTIKVHRLMCLELKKFIDRISEILPAIESAQPGCTSGIEAMCTIKQALDKAKLLIQHCSESSKLYLAITTERIVSRCKKIRKTLEVSLSQIQNMVPLLLAGKISGIAHDLQRTKFPLEPAEEEAGKVILGLLRQAIPVSNSVNDLELEAVRLAALTLKITSPSAVLIERRSIKSLHDKAPDTDPKKKILKWLFYLLRKYGTIIGRYQDDDSHMQCDETQADDFGTPEPPKEFKCPISLQVMHDPVIIASGLTFERFWIEQWFNEGNQTCPITQMTLDNLFMTPNSVLKELVSAWSSKQGITIPDPYLEPNTSSHVSLDSSFSSSIASIPCSVNYLNLQLSAVSIRSSGTDDVPEILDHFSESRLSCRHRQKNAVSQELNNSTESYGNMLASLSRLAALSWGSQCKTVRDVNKTLRENKHACHTTISNSCVEPLIKFLKDAHELNDVKQQRDGAEVLLMILRNSSEMLLFDKDGIYVLASYIDTEITGEVLGIIEVLSSQPKYKSMIVASGVLPSILKVLDTKTRDFHSIAMQILCNLSFNCDVGYHIVYLDCIPKLIQLLGDPDLARFCIEIIRNLCSIVEVRIAVAESSSCISDISQILETGTKEEQEHAADVLLFVCREHADFCQLVMRGTIIQSLFDLSLNGNSRGQKIASELLQLLENVKDDPPECSIPEIDLALLDISSSSSCQNEEKKPSYRAFWFFGKILSLYSIRSS
ncbi:U-box domain-containing protein 5-like isoform X2 [Juglans microcarpa x Juglans regia]|uniref:U-box domain-containing protein 5-like isoform X2 n=1 Tax=Juglans microcarpa x Juglans regia TaxID=2249226 RepID=UPI001B7E41A3|nr:U-box domain-containing protein 5-like isoform X2 [Juglans microcarpa x Juglans regia]